MHRFEAYFLAETLSKSILKRVKISNLGYIVTAITASSANEPGTNYQRLEFLGDSILKLCASIQLIAAYPLWHEGYLSAKKGITNPFLCFLSLILLCWDPEECFILSALTLHKRHGTGTDLS